MVVATAVAIALPAVDTNHFSIEDILAARM